MNVCRCGPNPDSSWFNSANALPPEWDQGLPIGHFLRRDSLKVHEGTKLPAVRTLYVLWIQQGLILARAAFQVIEVRDEHLSYEALPAWQAQAWKLFRRTLKPKMLVAGQLFRHDIQTVFFHPDVPPFDAFTWYRMMIGQALRRSHASAVLVKEPPAELVPYFQHHAPEYILLRNDSSMQMQIPSSWNQIGDYEKSLKHKYAQRFRKLRGAWKKLEVKELNAEDVRQRADELYALYLQVTQNQPVRLGFLSKEFLPDLKAFYGDELRVWAIYEQGKMIAFASGWVHQKHFDMFYIGFDYARNTELQLYFNILFFAIEQAILLKKRTVILGRTALEAKARVGCKPQYLNTFLYVHNPLLRRVITRLQDRFAESGSEWEQRHPFKPVVEVVEKAS
jgi:hypothetical protein